MEDQYPINLIFLTKLILYYLFFQRGINAIGEPTSQAITNWEATRGTPLCQRGATRDRSPGTEV